MQIGKKYPCWENNDGNVILNGKTKSITSEKVYLTVTIIGPSFVFLLIMTIIISAKCAKK